MDQVIEIPWESIESETLTNILAEYVTRDGTDYGEQEVPTDTKVSQVRRLLAQGTCVLIFQPEDQSLTLMDTQVWKQMQRGFQV